IPTYTPQASTSEYIDVDGWHEPTALFNVRVTTPGGRVTSWISPGASSGTVKTPDGSIKIDNDLTSDAKGAKKIFMYFYDSGDSIAPKPGTWTLDFQRTTGATTGKLDTWIPVYYYGGTTPPTFAAGAWVDSTVTLCSPSTGDSIISVTAYTTKRN